MSTYNKAKTTAAIPLKIEVAWKTTKPAASPEDLDDDEPDEPEPVDEDEPEPVDEPEPEVDDKATEVDDEAALQT